MSRFKLIFFSPVKNTQEILSHLFSKFPENVGRIGQYEQCAFLTSGTGQFKPLGSANPGIGSVGELEHVEEHRVEVLVKDQGQKEEIRGAIRELKKVRTNP